MNFDTRTVPSVLSTNLLRMLFLGKFSSYTSALVKVYAELGTITYMHIHSHVLSGGITNEAGEAETFII